MIFLSTFEGATNQLDSSNLAPAGVAGEAINLGLANPTNYAGSISVSITGVPSGWVLNEGTNNGDGTWTVQTGDVRRSPSPRPRLRRRDLPAYVANLDRLHRWHRARDD